MTVVPDLLWPGDERAGDLMSDERILDAMVRVEAAWLTALGAIGVAPTLAPETVLAWASRQDLNHVAGAAERGGNPVIALVDLMRSRATVDGARWLHRGLTSQDVLDTALVLTVHETVRSIQTDLRRHVETLTHLVDDHGATMMVGRTLTQHAVPLTFGVMASSWLDCVVDAANGLDLARSRLVAQIGGASGTLAALTELAASVEPTRADELAAEAVHVAGSVLRLATGQPWHTSRGRLVQTGSALVECTGAWGRIANDVAMRNRPEIAELAEGGADRGVSSSMPHKQNPVLTVLIRRAALSAPGLQATLHAAAAATLDQRPDGAWHAEWDALRTLARRTAVAASQTSELLRDLVVDADQMASTLHRSADDVLQERRSIEALTGARHDPDPRTYVGLSAQIMAASTRRAREWMARDR